MHFHEVLNASIQDYEYERKQIEELFSNSPWENIIALPGMPDTETLEVHLESAFRRSRIRGSAANFKAFFAFHSRYWQKPSLEGLFYYAEIMLNILDEFQDTIKKEPCAKSLACQIEENIRRLLAKTNHKQIRMENGLIAIVPNDPVVAMAIEDMTDMDAARAVLEFTHYGLKGNLEKKRELLRKIGHYVEPILQDAEMKGTYGWLTKDLGCCLNSLHIRHNNKEGDKANAVVQAMSDGELEECYDNTYREMLLLIELQKNLPFRRKVEGLREQLGGKKGGSAG